MWTCCTLSLTLQELHQSFPINLFEGKLHNLCDLDISQNKTLHNWCDPQLHNSSAQAPDQTQEQEVFWTGDVFSHTSVLLSLSEQFSLSLSYFVFVFAIAFVFVSVCLRLCLCFCLYSSLSFVIAPRGDVFLPELCSLVPVRAVLRLLLNLLTDLPDLSHQTYLLPVFVFIHFVCLSGTM